MAYAPGVRPGTWKTPDASVTPVISFGSTGLVIETVAPGMTAPCASTALTDRTPVCTCARAATGTSRVTSATPSRARNLLRIETPPDSQFRNLNRRLRFPAEPKRYTAGILGMQAFSTSTSNVCTGSQPCPQRTALGIDHARRRDEWLDRKSTRL